MRLVRAPVVCPRCKKGQHPLECACARDILEKHPHKTELVYLGPRLDYVRLTVPA